MTAPICGLRCREPMTQNPHPDAGKPATLLTVGAVWVCIPCTQLALHGWTKRALEAEAALRAKDTEGNGYRDARGAVPVPPGTASPEDTIRKLRGG